MSEDQVSGKSAKVVCNPDHRCASLGVSEAVWPGSFGVSGPGGAAEGVGEQGGIHGGGSPGGTAGPLLAVRPFFQLRAYKPKTVGTTGFHHPQHEAGRGPGTGGGWGVDEVLAGLLHERVVGYLDAVERLAVLEGTRQSAYEARRLVASWRALLRAHEPTARGGCAACGRTRRGRMCPVWRVACAYFVHRLPWEPRIRR